METKTKTNLTMKKWKIKKIKINISREVKMYFGIGALTGLVLFLAVYGFRVLDFTYDGWLLTGKDLQQHYLGWKFFRRSPWTFPVGMHDSFTAPDSISVLYTDSIPLFALFFKLLSPILPQTFQYFGLFGLMCYVLNGGMASLIVSKFNKSKLVCGAASVFFILSPPVLQRLYGVLSENSRHTSLAAHFLILGALAVWLFKDKFQDYKKDVIAWVVLAALCVLIQMYIIFMVGGILCGYLLDRLISDRDWKRVAYVFSGFVGSFLFFFFVVGGFTSLLSSGGSGYGFFSANLNTFINAWHYSTFFDGLAMTDLQYEGFAYLGLGMIILCMIAFALLVKKAAGLIRRKCFWETLVKKVKRKFSVIVPLGIVVFVFSVLAFSNFVYLGSNIFIEVHWPKVIDDLLAVIRSSGRFIWCVMYILMIFALYIVSKYFKPNVQKIIIIACVCVQIADLAAPIHRLQKQYFAATAEDDSLVTGDFWTEEMENYDRIVYFPSEGYNPTQMLQIGSKASAVRDMKMSNFYLSRYMTKKASREKDKETEKIFRAGELDDRTIYILDYDKAHKYKGMCHIYMVDNKIIALKNPVYGLEEYTDFLVGTQTPVVELDMSFAGLGSSFLHRGWHSPEYGDKGAWTSYLSVVRVYSDDAQKANISIQYEGGKKKGTTEVRMNGKRIGKILNNTSGTVTFEAALKPCKNIKKSKYINWLFLESDDVKKAKKAGEKDGKGIFVKKVTVTYVE